MSMHDKDIDALFRSKLDDLEVEPSAGVYANISRELHGGKRHKSIAPLLGVAASVIIILSAGLFFLLKNKKADQTPLKNRLVKNQPVKQVVPIQPVITNSPVNMVQQQLQKVQSKQQSAVHHPTPVVQQALVTEEAEPTAAPVSQPVQLKAKDSVVTVVAANQLVVPVAPVSIKPAAIVPDLVVVPTSVPVGDEEKPGPTKKSRIHGLGGLLNAVIASVDKRPDKIIEFTDTDEGDKITGINLGIIKIKKQN